MLTQACSTNQIFENGLRDTWEAVLDWVTIKPAAAEPLQALHNMCYYTTQSCRWTETREQIPYWFLTISPRHRSWHLIQDFGWMITQVTDYIFQPYKQRNHLAFQTNEKANAEHTGKSEWEQVQFALELHHYIHGHYEDNTEVISCELEDICQNRDQWILAFTHFRSCSLFWWLTLIIILLINRSDSEGLK